MKRKPVGLNPGRNSKSHSLIIVNTVRRSSNSHVSERDAPSSQLLSPDEERDSPTTTSTLGPETRIEAQASEQTDNVRLLLSSDNLGDQNEGSGDGTSRGTRGS